MNWEVGNKIKHDKLGEGKVTHVFGSGDKVSIAVSFSGGSPKILDPRHAPIERPEHEPENWEFTEQDFIDLDKQIAEEAALADMPVRVAVGERSCWRWKGAEFATREEMLLGKALLDQGAMVASNSHLLLRESEKLHRKPDLLVFLNYEGRLLAGIVEVDGSAHDGRWVEDQTRSHELQRNGFMAVRHYTAEKVFDDATWVAKDFLGFLKQFHPHGQRSSLLRM